jgi:hypothetical protein
MNNPSPHDETQSEPLSRHEARLQRRAARRAALGLSGSGTAWIGGLVLILLGVVFLLQNMGAIFFPFNNWWALFILIPAFGALSVSYQTYRAADNQLTTRSRNSLILGLILLALTGSFLFNLNMNIMGPVLIILAGLGILINAMMPKNEA